MPRALCAAYVRSMQRPRAAQEGASPALEFVAPLDGNRDDGPWGWGGTMSDADIKTNCTSGLFLRP